MLFSSSLASKLFVALVGIVATVGIACGSDEGGNTGSSCTPGATNSCVCPGTTASGVQVCSTDGKSYGACDCGMLTNCGDGKLDLEKGEQCDDGNKDNTDGCTDKCVISSCGNNVEDPGECDASSEFYCPTDCDTGTGGAGGDPCAGQLNYAGITTPQPSAWVFNALTSLEAGDAMCDALLPGQGAHVCEYQQVKAAEANGEFLNAGIMNGTTVWIHRTTDEIVNGQLSPAGPGGRCNEWTYTTNHISDGEYATFQDNVPIYSLDNDTFYDGIDTTHTIPNELQCGPTNGVLRSILCCYPVCTSQP